MKKCRISRIIILFIIALTSVGIFAQTKMIEIKAGHTFKVSFPEYMSKTAGLNGYSSIEYKSEAQGVYSLVIYDLKEDLKLIGLNFNSTREFCDYFVKDFFKDVEKKPISAPVSKKMNEVNFIEVDMDYFDKETNMEFYYLIGIVETKKAFYKVIASSAKKDKDKFKGDFQKILYSLKD